MPIYEYRCAQCGAEFEKLVSGPRAVTCPSCQSSQVKRTLSVFGFKSGSTFVASSGGCGCTPSSCGCR